MNLLIQHLSAEEIIHIHNRAIQAFGGLPGLACPSQIDALIARVVNLSVYEGVSDLYALAAMYCISIARGHVFVDGNKRTALNSAILFFLKNGIRLYSVPGIENVLVKVASGEMLLAELTEFFRSMPRTVIRPKSIS